MLRKNCDAYDTWMKPLSAIKKAAVDFKCNAVIWGKVSHPQEVVKDFRLYEIIVGWPNNSTRALKIYACGFRLPRDDRSS